MQPASLFNSCLQPALRLLQQHAAFILRSTEYGVHTSSEFRIWNRSHLFERVQTRQFSSESSAIQYPFDPVSFITHMAITQCKWRGNESVVFGLGASPDCSVDPSLDGKDSFLIRMHNNDTWQTLPLHQVIFGRSQTLSRRTPTVKVAGWKALMVAISACINTVYVYSVHTPYPAWASWHWHHPMNGRYMLHTKPVHIQPAEPNWIVWPATIIHRLSKLYRQCYALHGIEWPITTSLVTSSTQVQLLCRRCEIMSSSAKSFNSDFSLASCIMYEYNTVFSRGGVEWVYSCSIWSEMFAEALLYVMPNCIHFLRYSLYLPILEWFHCSS